MEREPEQDEGADRDVAALEQLERELADLERELDQLDPDDTRAEPQEQEQ